MKFALILTCDGTVLTAADSPDELDFWRAYPYDLTVYPLVSHAWPVSTLPVRRIIAAILVMLRRSFVTSLWLGVGSLTCWTTLAP